MDSGKLLEELFDHKILKILKLFMDFEDKRFYLREISQISKVPIASTFRIVRKLVNLELVRELHINKFKFYMLDDNSKVAFLKKFLKEGIQIIQSFADQVSALPGIQYIILHGNEEKGKANILLIGEDINLGEVKRICAEIQERYNFKISTLNLTEDQFMQMSNMGLYQGEKKVLYKRA